MKKTLQLEINSKLLVKNTLLNFIGQVLPLVIGLVTIPFVVRGLGIERYGLFSMALVVMGYFTVFDLGLGRATTKYVAEALGKGEENQIPNIIWTAVTFQTALGSIGAIVVFCIADLIIVRVLNIPPYLIGEAKNTFYLIALSIPLVLVSSSFSGVLEAVQRFDLENAIKIPTSILTFILPLVGLYFGLGLFGIVALILLARFGALIAFIVIDFHIIPKLNNYSVSFTRFSYLFAYGGWVTVSNVVSPILVYLDRFMISSLLTIAAVTYYTAPFDAITRLLIISNSLTLTLFPAFSALGVSRERQRLGTILARSFKYILLVSGPIVIIVFLFAKQILQIWLGTDFAVESAIVLQILAIGVLINSLAYTPFAFLQGIGRPEIPAKFHLLELPIYIGMMFILMGKFGIIGAAGAWTLRVTLDALLLYGATFKVYGFSPRLLATNGTIFVSFLLIALAGIGYVLKTVVDSLPLLVQSLFVVGILALFAGVTWIYALDSSDREIVLKVIKLIKKEETPL